MSTEIKLEIEYPAGYELAESKARQVVNGEYYMGHDFSLCHWTERKSSISKYIILKKKAPEYSTLDGLYGGKKYVEIKALADALFMVTPGLLGEIKMAEFEKLKDLLK